MVLKVDGRKEEGHDSRQAQANGLCRIVVVFDGALHAEDADIGDYDAGEIRDEPEVLHVLVSPDYSRHERQREPQAKEHQRLALRINLPYPNALHNQPYDTEQTTGNNLQDQYDYPVQSGRRRVHVDWRRRPVRSGRSRNGDVADYLGDGNPFVHAFALDQIGYEDVTQRHIAL